MAKVLLAINSGSSSVKISVFSATFRKTPQQIAEAQVSGLTAGPVAVFYTCHNKTKKKAEKAWQPVEQQDDAFELLLGLFIDDPNLQEIKSKADIAITCHRIVHGGDYASSQLIGPVTYDNIEALSNLAPLHNRAALTIVRSCLDQLPDAANIAYFDSQFHSTIPEHIRTYPVNPDIARKNGLRKYGFHGLSYSFITRSVAGYLGKEIGELSIIALHLGSGASACAIKNGQSWDTSMGLTPLAGLPGATRSGSVDPSLVFHYTNDVGKLTPYSTPELHISRAEDILNKQSGWKSLTGTTDFRAISESDDPACKLAFDIFVDRICGFVGSYYVALRGQVDALVFAGGIGEKSSKLRDRVAQSVSCLGFEIDDTSNAAEITDVVQDVSAKGSRHGVLVCQTDEQFEMARSCAEDERIW
ncbi:acetate kinase [Sodiomyces alkalinus F11]|uniref:Probable acetate kinase n=1 Tax=Sodiomyces alkalinus (strain CBS 110278 / VKM F-3762 / F11) TaxID=1314773 RepID=A0A3N2PRN0_SODAK|nr:acetate kinase [Sodiomyces alkalinus F11]ROT37016.1 acetate kinase [Sodiomyces alkalinus F11]